MLRRNQEQMLSAEGFFELAMRQRDQVIDLMSSDRPSDCQPQKIYDLYANYVENLWKSTVHGGWPVILYLAHVYNTGFYQVPKDPTLVVILMGIYNTLNSRYDAELPIDEELYTPLQAEVLRLRGEFGTRLSPGQKYALDVHIHKGAQYLNAFSKQHGIIKTFNAQEALTGTFVFKALIKPTGMLAHQLDSMFDAHDGIENYLRTHTVDDIIKKGLSILSGHSISINNTSATDDQTVPKLGEGPEVHAGYSED